MGSVKMYKHHSMSDLGLFFFSSSVLSLQYTQDNILNIAWKNLCTIAQCYLNAKQMKLSAKIKINQTDAFIFV